MILRGIEFLQNENTACLEISNLEWVRTATSRISNLETEIIDTPKTINIWGGIMGYVKAINLEQAKITTPFTSDYGDVENTVYIYSEMLG